LYFFNEKLVVEEDSSNSIKDKDFSEKIIEVKNE